MERLDLSWGNPYFLLELLSKVYNPSLNRLYIDNCTYAPDNGVPELLEHIKEITEQTTGNTYKHYLVTNGATSAINSIMRVWRDYRDVATVTTSKLGFPYYPTMINKANLIHRQVDLKNYQVNNGYDMVIIDSPANPTGEQFSNQGLQNVVFDGVYHNKIYNYCPIIQPKHDSYVGSFSKLLGLTGARIGWIATNNDLEFETIVREVLYENATVSRPSQELIVDILNYIDLNEFMKMGKNSLDENRHIMQKLEGLIGSPVSEKGMFYCAEVDQKMFDLFDRANVTYIKLEMDGKQLIRLNLGQTRDILTKAVNSIQKTDGVKNG